MSETEEARVDSPSKIPEPLTEREREQMIGNAIWSFSLSGIQITREEAEAALDEALSEPLRDF